MAATTPAPSTVADSPIDEALAKLMGTQGPLSKTTGTNPIGYDPNQTFRPTGDTLNISNLGGSGVSTPEQWTHEIQLANLAQQSAQQEYTKQAAAQEFAYKTAQDVLANQRSAAQLAMQQAEARRASALGPAQLQAAQLANEQTRQAMGVQTQQLALQKQQQELANYERTGYLPAWVREQAYNTAANLQLGPLGQATAQKYLQAGLSPYTAYTNAYGVGDPQAYMKGGTTLYNTMTRDDELNRQIYAGRAAAGGINPDVMTTAMQRAIGGYQPTVGQWSGPTVGAYTGR